MIENAIMDHRVTTEPSRVDDFKVGPATQRFLGKFAAAHLGHDHIREQQVDAGVRIEQGQSFFRVLRDNDFVAEFSESFLDDETHPLIVFNDKDEFF